jgi:putative Mg2+ transporter-C (MgtC) family protein
MFDWGFEGILAMRIIIAAVLGGAVGWQRERAGQEAGWRTYATVALGSCVFGLISVLPNVAEGSRVAAGVVTGVGFLCAGVILQDRGGHIRGLTTAASIWATAATGLVVAFSQYVLAVIVTLILVAVLSAKKPDPEPPVR